MGDIEPDDVLGVLGRVGLVRPVLFSVRISPTADPDSTALVDLHLDGDGWRLSGFELPKAIVRQLAASLPVR